MTTGDRQTSPITAFSFALSFAASPAISSASLPIPSSSLLYSSPLSAAKGSSSEPVTPSYFL
jgi:hypothetical protein